VKNQIYFGAFWDHPPGSIGDPAPVGSKLTPCSFVARYVPDKAEPAGVYFDMMSSVIREFGDESAHLVRLRAAIHALMPHLLELKSAWQRLDEDVRGGQVDKDKLGRDNFLANWLTRRCRDAFEAIIDLPRRQMAPAALAFKPTGVPSFVNDIERNAYIIRLIPADQMTLELALRAVRQDPNSLRRVPESLRTKEVCAEAVAGTGGLEVLQYVPQELRSAELCRVAVERDGRNVRHVPVRTEELCAIACVQTGLAWWSVPKEQRTLVVEFCAAMHGYLERSAERVFQDLQAAEPDSADATADKYQALFERLHYPSANEDDLADLGLLPRLARQVERG